MFLGILAACAWLSMALLGLAKMIDTEADAESLAIERDEAAAAAKLNTPPPALPADGPGAVEAYPDEGKAATADRGAAPLGASQEGRSRPAKKPPRGARPPNTAKWRGAPGTWWAVKDRTGKSAAAAAFRDAIAKRKPPMSGGGSPRGKFGGAASGPGAPAGSLRKRPERPVEDPEERGDPGGPGGPSPDGELQMVIMDVASQERKLVDLKKEGKFVERDGEAGAAARTLQQSTQRLLRLQYGSPTRNLSYLVHMTLRFPAGMADAHGQGRTGTIAIETAPINLMPHAVFRFLEIARQLQVGYFHRRAHHVLQAQIESLTSGTRGAPLAFQEYSPLFPHEKWTLGFAGRPGGPAFYISTVNNTRNHGPASQGSALEADSCFGRIVGGFAVAKRMYEVWGTKQGGLDFKADKMGFIPDRSHWVEILAMKIAGQRANSSAAAAASPLV